MSETGVAILGATGGREQALKQAMEASPEVGRVEVSADIRQGLARFDGGPKPFVIIGPEAPLVAGAADDLRAEGYTVFGAGREAAQYEADKALTAKMLGRAGLPYPATRISTTLAEDEAIIGRHAPKEYVIKANGLAGGKGVVLPATKEEALETVRAMRGGAYDNAGREIILFQRRHRGPEFSAMVVVGDNDEYIILPFAQDHKRLEDGDRGPNTGGMGAYAPVPESIIGPVQYGQTDQMAFGQLTQMRIDSRPFERGLLYMGLMADEEVLNIEDNVRFGDPETQVVLPLLVNAGVDVYRLLRSAAEGSLEPPQVDLRKLGQAAITVCLAAPGYPDSERTRKGATVYGLDGTYPGVTIQEAGVTDGKVSGGRAMYATATGPDLPTARERVYAAIDQERQGPDSGKVGFKDMQFRTDIGHQAL